MSTLTDSVQVLAQTIGKTLEPVFKWALTQATVVVSEIQRLIDEANNTGGARDREAQYARNADAFVRRMGLNPFTQQGMMAEMRQRNIEQQRADYELARQRARSAAPAALPGAPSVTAPPPLGGSAGAVTGATGSATSGRAAAAEVKKTVQELLGLTPAEFTAAVNTAIGEYGGLDPRGRTDVFANILARSRSPQFPSNLVDVVMQPGQYAPNFGRSRAQVTNPNLYGRARFEQVKAELMDAQMLAQSIQDVDSRLYFKGISEQRNMVRNVDFLRAPDQNFFHGPGRTDAGRNPQITAQLLSQLGDTGAVTGYLDRQNDANKQRKEQLKEQLNTSERMTRESLLQLNALRVSDPLLRAAVEAGNEELQIMQKYSDLKAQALSDEVKANYEAAQKNELESNTLKFSEQLKQQHSTMLDGLLDINKTVRDRLAYDREYEGLVRTGINPELAKQLMELDKIAKATYDSLQARIATLELAASSLPVESAIRKELEAQAAALNLQRGSINDINEDTRKDLFSTYQKTEGQKIEAQIATLKNDLAEMTSIATVAGRSAEAIGGAFGNAFRDLISGAASARQVLSGFFEDVAQGFAQMASEIIAKQMAMIALQTVLKALGAIGGSAGGAANMTDVGRYADSASAVTMADFPVLPRALGGPVSPGHPFPVGENGPELFVPYQAGSIIPAEAAEALQAINDASMRGLQVPFQGGGSSSGSSGLSVPYQGGGSSSGSSGLQVPFQRGMEGLSVPFQRGGGDASGGMGGGGGSWDSPIRFESVIINREELVTRKQAEEIGRRSEQRGAALALKRYRNNTTDRRAAGLS